jgi:hypothetical protein
MSQKLETIDPEHEPEYVGAHSALVDEQCQNYFDANADKPDEPFVPERCEGDTTHTVVLADSDGLHEQSLCDDCGEPDDTEHLERSWSGELRDG